MSIRVVLTPLLPHPPTPGEQARRIVRHGMADVLAWLGQDVGPAPDADTHAVLVNGVPFVSRREFDRLRAAGVDVRISAAFGGRQ